MLAYSACGINCYDVIVPEEGQMVPRKHYQPIIIEDAFMNADLSENER